MRGGAPTAEAAKPALNVIATVMSLFASPFAAAAGSGVATGTFTTVGVYRGTTSLATMGNAYRAAGGVTRIAGYEVAGVFGKVGNTFNANIWGLYRTKASKGMFSFIKSLEAQAKASGANRISIVGTHIVNPTFYRGSRLGYNITQINSTTVRLTKLLP